jgi:hypothetical protein
MEQSQTWITNFCESLEISWQPVWVKWIDAVFLKAIINWSVSWSFKNFHALVKLIDGILLSLIWKLIMCTNRGRSLKISWCKVSIKWVLRENHISSSNGWRDRWTADQFEKFYLLIKLLDGFKIYSFKSLLCPLQLTKIWISRDM